MKHNKTWYINRIKKAEQKLEDIRTKIQQAIDTENCDIINDLYDQRHDLEQDIESLDRQCSRRNWTTAEWNSWDLITSNID